MNYLYKILLTINATSWMIIIYAIKEKWTVGQAPPLLFGLALLFIPIVLSFFSIIIARFLGEDALRECEEYSLADNEFLPTYLGHAEQLLFFIKISALSRFFLWAFKCFLYPINIGLAQSL